MSRHDRHPRTPLKPDQTWPTQTIAVYDYDLWNAARAVALEHNCGLSWLVEVALRELMSSILPPPPDDRQRVDRLKLTITSLKGRLKDKPRTKPTASESKRPWWSLLDDPNCFPD